MSRSEKNGKSKKRVSETETEWSCTSCTFLNSSSATKCEMCESLRGTSSRRAVGNPQVQQLQEQLDHEIKTSLKQKKQRTHDRAKNGGRATSALSFTSESAASSHGSESLPRTSESPYQATDDSATTATSVRSSVIRLAKSSLSEPEQSSSSAPESTKHSIPSISKLPSPIPERKIVSQTESTVEVKKEKRQKLEKLKNEVAKVGTEGHYKIFSVTYGGVTVDFEELVLSEAEDSDA